MKVAIGVCAKNEGTSIIPMLNSLITSCKIANNIKPYLFICANGCSDQTIPLIENWQKINQLFCSTLYILREGNLVAAQRLIIENVMRNGIADTIFLDADILIDSNFMNEIVKQSIDDEESIAFYAKSIPLVRNKCTLVEKTMNLYDISCNMFSRRKHLHGRAFLIRTKHWAIPETVPPLVADDIFLSFHLQKNFGNKSIKNIDKAIVYFNQITDYRDFYNTYRRRELEIKKCFKLFPHFKVLTKDQVNRIFLWKNLYREPFGKIILWITLLCLRNTAKIQLIIENIFKVNNNKDQWISTITSK